MRRFAFTFFLIAFAALASNQFCPLETGGFSVCVMQIPDHIARTLPGYVPGERPYGVTGKRLPGTDADEVMIVLEYRDANGKKWMMTHQESVRETGASGGMIHTAFYPGEGSVAISFKVIPRKRRPVAID